MLTKQGILLRRGTQEDSSRVKELRRSALPEAHSLRFYGDQVNFRVVFGQSF